MATKGAKKSAKNDEATVVLDYLRKQNRPYNANDIFQNLHGQIGKTGIVKVLNQLAADGSISLKTYGKQQVFVARQDEIEVPSQDEIDRMDDQIVELKEQLAELQAQTKEAAATLSQLRSSLTLGELRARHEELSARIAKSTERLRVLKEGTNVVDPAEAKRINEQYERNRKAWRQRRKMCLEIMDTILESANMKKSEFIEMVGIETDEAAGVKFE